MKIDTQLLNQVSNDKRLPSTVESEKKFPYGDINYLAVMIRLQKVQTYVETQIAKVPTTPRMENRSSSCTLSLVL